jgi:hypothetical protein
MGWKDSTETGENSVDWIHLAQKGYKSGLFSTLKAY